MQRQYPNLPRRYPDWGRFHTTLAPVVLPPAPGMHHAQAQKSPLRQAQIKKGADSAPFRRAIHSPRGSLSSLPKQKQNLIWGGLCNKQANAGSAPAVQPLQPRSNASHSRLKKRQVAYKNARFCYKSAPRPNPLPTLAAHPRFRSAPQEPQPSCPRSTSGAIRATVFTAVSSPSGQPRSRRPGPA